MATLVPQPPSPERARTLSPTLYTGRDKYGTFLVIGDFKCLMPSPAIAAEVEHRVRAYPELVRVAQLVSVLLAAPTNRMGKPEFHSGPQHEAREEIRKLAVHHQVAQADTVLHQAFAVLSAVLREIGEAA